MVEILMIELVEVGAGDFAGGVMKNGRTWI